MTIALHSLGYTINHKIVYRIMKEENLQCKIRMKKYKSYRGEVGKVAPNHLNREFTSEKAYEKLSTDITEFRVNGKKLYGSAVIDMYNGEILSFDLSQSPNLSQIKRTLAQLSQVLPENSKPMIHSDQGWQYRHEQYVKTLESHHWTQSMSRKGNCYDNSIIENFFGILKSEFYEREEFTSRREFEEKLYAYLDYYNHKRIKLKLKASPVDYRLKNMM